MARSIKIAATRTADLAPLGAAKERDYVSITDYVAAALGEEAAALFAEPVSHRDGTAIDWYIRQFGRVEAFSALDETSQASLLRMLDAISTRLSDLAQSLQRSSEPADRFLGKALVNAIKVPGREYIYSVNGKPVLVAWGYRLNDHRPMSGGISTMAPVAPQPEASIAPQVLEPHPEEAPLEEQPYRFAEAETDQALPSQPVLEKKKHGWRCVLIGLLWALLALLIAAILFLLLKACSISAFFPWIDYCPGRYQSDLVSLQQEVRLLENALAFKNENCDAVASDQAPIADAELDKRLDERNAGNGSLQVSLAWNGGSDLDLAVRCDTGVVWFNEPQNCGATLDTDSNGHAQVTMTPVENIVWPDSATIPVGDIPIFVTLFSYRGQPQQNIPYTVRVVRRQDGKITSQYTINGVASRSQVKQPKHIGFANRQ